MDFDIKLFDDYRGRNNVLEAKKSKRRFTEIAYRIRTLPAWQTIMAGVNSA